MGDEPGFLLESVEHERWGRWSFVGRRPAATIVRARRQLTRRRAAAARTSRSTRACSPPSRRSSRRTARRRLPDLPPLHGGLVGYLGYDIVREVERLPDVPADDLGNPDAVLSIIGELAAYDHYRQRVTLVANAFVPPGATAAELDVEYEDALARLDQIADDGARADQRAVGRAARPDEPLPEVRSSMGLRLYCDAVEAAREHILAGDIFQVVLAQRYDLDLDAEPVRRVPRAAAGEPEPVHVLHAQPRTHDRRVVARADGAAARRPGHLTPDRGTRRRGHTDEDDRRLAAELTRASEGTRRARHARRPRPQRRRPRRQFGTEQVDEMMTLERYSHVMHLTSQVSGTLRDGLGPIDVLRATLPAGTVSGAPKVRAMEIIDSLEPVKRGPYAGVVGYIDFSGNLDTAIAIRTMVVAARRPGVRRGRRRHRGRLGSRARGPRVPQQGAGTARGRPAARRMTATRRGP